MRNWRFCVGILKRAKTAKKVLPPKFMNTVHDCDVCGGRFRVTPRTHIVVSPTFDALGAVCPYCGSESRIDRDVHYNYKRKLSAFVHSQVEPIKAIKDENVRLPMQRLLDDFNKLLEDDSE